MPAPVLEELADSGDFHDLASSDRRLGGGWIVKAPARTSRWAAAGSIATFVYYVPILAEFSRMGVLIDASALVTFNPIPVILIVAAVGWSELRAERARSTEPQSV